MLPDAKNLMTSAPFALSCAHAIAQLIGRGGAALDLIERRQDARPGILPAVMSSRSCLSPFQPSDCTVVKPAITVARALS